MYYRLLLCDLDLLPFFAVRADFDLRDLDLEFLLTLLDFVRLAPPLRGIDAESADAVDIWFINAPWTDSIRLIEFDTNGRTEASAVCRDDWSVLFNLE